MKLTNFAFFLLWLPASFASANPEKEKAIYSVFNAVVDARFDHEFGRLSRLMHPSSLQLWRKIMNIEYERLAEETSTTEVQSIIGLTSSPLDSELSDTALFEKLASRALELDPTFAGSEEVLPFKVQGLLFEADGMAWLAYDFSRTHKSKRSSVTARNPRIHTFRRIDWTWKLHTTILTGEITAVWRNALIRRQRRPPNRASIILPTPSATKSDKSTLLPLPQ